jgi:hypothetical protein
MDFEAGGLFNPQPSSLPSLLFKQNPISISYYYPPNQPLPQTYCFPLVYHPSLNSALLPLRFFFLSNICCAKFVTAISINKNWFGIKRTVVNAKAK